MTRKPVRLRELANRDIDAVIEHYLGEASEKVALGFIDELEKAFTRISANPRIGSLRYAHELDIPDLRFKAIARYPSSCSTLSATMTSTSGAFCMVSVTSPRECGRKTNERWLRNARGLRSSRSCYPGAICNRPATRVLIR